MVLKMEEDLKLAKSDMMKLQLEFNNLDRDYQSLKALKEEQIEKIAELEECIE